MVELSTGEHVVSMYQFYCELCGGSHLSLNDRNVDAHLASKQHQDLYYEAKDNWRLQQILAFATGSGRVNEGDVPGSKNDKDKEGNNSNSNNASGGSWNENEMVENRSGWGESSSSSNHWTQFQRIS
jgi:hypothetical protein